MSIPEGDKSFYAKDRKAWRQWLARNHSKEKKVWLLIYHKTSETPSVYYSEAVEEALCYGWIDSRPSKRDAESFFLSFSPRKPRSVWSKVNKQRVSKLIADGLMQPAGMKMIDLAKSTGMWEALNKIDNLEMPEDLQKALKKNKKALEYFIAFPPSSKKIILGWVLNAKRAETREKRIKEVVSLAARNQRANHYKPKDT
jgi:uncharacterized protein YdeI (YjbR/CyaY-like superfamily)